jgi:phosphohistidine phosphatase SixA
MALKKLIVVRHGQYAGNFLTQEGSKRIEALGDTLAPILAGTSVAIFSSPAMRAVRTAWILEEKLPGATFDREDLYPFLESKNEELTPRQASEAANLVEEAGETYEAVILSTHLEFVEEFPSFWGVRRDQKIPFAHGLPPGSARIISVATGKVEEIRS